jgi:hypothetical protein
MASATCWMLAKEDERRIPFRLFESGDHIPGADQSTYQHRQICRGHGFLFLSGMTTSFSPYTVQLEITGQICYAGN